MNRLARVNVARGSKAAKSGTDSYVFCVISNVAPNLDHRIHADLAAIFFW